MGYNEKPNGKPIGDDETPDVALALLCKVWAKLGDPIGITVLVGGRWVTGTVCSSRSWFEHVAHLADRNGPDQGDPYRMLGRVSSPTTDEVEAGIAGSVDPEDLPRFLHLRNARSVDTSGFIPSDDGALLRIRLDRVDAWLLGHLSEPGYSPPPPAV